MTECLRCLYSDDHPLGLTINDQGICSGCSIHDEKYSIDWDERFLELLRLVDPYRSTSNYDCIVPVSGGGDSFYILHIVKNLLGLNPLVVSHNILWNTPTGIYNLEHLRNTFNVDILYQTINPTTIKKIVREMIHSIGSVNWPVTAGHTVFPVNVSIRKQIPLIIWGCHQGVEQVGMFSHLDSVEMTHRYRVDHDLIGIEPSHLTRPQTFLNPKDISSFAYPSPFEISLSGTRGIYLSNYFYWDTLAHNKAMSERYGFKASRCNRTFDCFDHVDSYIHTDSHDILKFLKHGISKVTDQLCREIRFNRIDRNQALVINS